MKTLLSPEEAKTLGRPIGKVSADKILAYIAEIEQTIIRRKIGNVLYLTLVETDHETDKTYDVLLNGGKYKDKQGTLKYITGLKTAESYYTYAQYVRSGDIESTRYGLVHKDGEYSEPISSKERDSAANTATEIGDAYMGEIISYCFDQGFLKPGDSRNGLNITAGCVIRKIKKQ